MKLDTLERFLARLAVLMSAAALATAYLLEFRVPVTEVFFALICGASTVSILEALR